VTVVVDMIACSSSGSTYIYWVGQAQELFLFAKKYMDIFPLSDCQDNMNYERNTPSVNAFWSRDWTLRVYLQTRRIALTHDPIFNSSRFVRSFNKAQLSHLKHGGCPKSGYGNSHPALSAWRCFMCFCANSKSSVKGIRFRFLMKAEAERQV
jgi:hypothetical protein